MYNILLNALLIAIFACLAHCLPQTLSSDSSTSSSPSPSASPSIPPPPPKVVNEADRNKYFHEPGTHAVGEDDRIGHYDTRYYHGLVSWDERAHTLSHMTKAYLTTFQSLGLETWIAHGTLLGWWWNGEVRS